VRQTLRLTANVDENTWLLALENAHRNYLGDLLGECYTGLCERKAAGTLTVEDLALIDQLGHTVSYATKYLWLLDNPGYTATNSGYTANVGADFLGVTGQFDRADRAAVERAIANAQNLRDKEWGKVVTFLNDNPTEYPCWQVQDCCCTYAPTPLVGSTSRRKWVDNRRFDNTDYTKQEARQRRGY